jgi:hypothetical protein
MRSSLHLPAFAGAASGGRAAITAATSVVLMATPRWRLLGRGTAMASSPSVAPRSVYVPRPASSSQRQTSSSIT